MRRRCRSALALTLVAGCSSPAPSPAPVAAAAPDPIPAALQRLREREQTLRGAPGLRWSSGSGPEPFAVRTWGEGFVGLLRHASAVVLLDRLGREQARLDVSAGASGWDAHEDTLYVVGERSASIDVVTVGPDGLSRLRTIEVEGADALRDVVVDPRGGWYLADRHRGRIARVDAQGRSLAQVACLGVIDLERTPQGLVANCLLEHTVRLYAFDDSQPLGLREQAAVTHDGPMWSMAPRTAHGGLELALGGVEDHPLERSDGAFGFIDSFVFRVRMTEHGAERLSAVDVAEHGVVTPKGMVWEGDTLWVSGAGSDALVSIDYAADAPQIRKHAAPPGVTALARRPGTMLGADPLLDRWVHFDAGGSWSTAAIASEDDRDTAVRVGEALVFTTLLAPQGTARGRRSRFTCETCHFEGTVDGRVHYTGRDDVHATTKTLRGLVGNHPHFSRALDRSTTDMIHNEFRVANAQTPQDPWFSIEVDEVPWLELLGASGTLGPAELRASMLAFLATLGPEQNPSTRGRRTFAPLEQRGAQRFEALCERCHQARTIADAPASRLAPSRWERAVFDGPRPLWATDERFRVGIEPYVHEDGARVPSLRNLWVKRPYLTRGSATELRAVLTEVRVGIDDVHGGGGGGVQLSAEDLDALEAFIDLL